MIIVEDEIAVRRGLECFMPWSELGFEVADTFGDGLEAFEYLKNNPCDVVLTDIMMSGMDGLEMTKRLRELYPDILIIILSGYSHFEYAQLALRYKVSNYLLKPVDEEELIDVFEKLKEELENRKRRLFCREDQAQKKLSIDILEKIHYEEIVADYKLFVNALDSGNTSLICKLIGDLIQKMSEIPIEYIQFILKNLYSLIEMEYDHRNISTHDITDGVFNYSNLKEKDNLCEIKASMNVAFLDLSRRLGEMKEESDADIIEVVERFIDANLAKDLNSTLLAEKFRINTDYLNRLFKQKKGETVTECIVRKRIEKAMMLLKEKKCKVNEVGRRVGYNSSSYFTRAFKDYAGCTPTEYCRKVVQ